MALMALVVVSFFINSLNPILFYLCWNVDWYELTKRHPEA
jgi:hypothetical protein